jgi:GTPase SAR1 family protein
LQHEIKLLLLGAGESGKSTIAKQMKVIFMSGYSEEERAPYKEIVHSNVILAMRSLMIALNKIGFIDSLNPENKANAQLFLSNDILFEQEVKKEIGAAVKALWNDPELRKKYQSTSEFQIHDSAQYYFDQIDRISQEDYLPTVQDVLQSRARTTGITEVQFNVDDVRFRMVDVGGQRSERKKWIHCFQEVTALIFCVSMSEYDLKLYEDETVNRMHESMMLFEEICNCQWFSDTAIILFLNKSDIFNEKIQRVDLKVCFPEYTGGCDSKAGTTFLRDKFSSLNRNKQKSIYCHVTCATNTDNISYVFNAVRDIILRISLAKTSM